MYLHYENGGEGDIFVSCDPGPYAVILRRDPEDNELIYIVRWNTIRIRMDDILTRDDYTPR